jgi:hypothetical protein
LLKKAVGKYESDVNWKSISEAVFGGKRSTKACYKRWTMFLDGVGTEVSNRHHWTDQEDAILFNYGGRIKGQLDPVWGTILPLLPGQSVSAAYT